MATTTTTLVKVAPSNDAEMVAFYNEGLRLRAYAEARAIITADDLKPATDDLSIIANVKKAIEEKRKDYLKPFQEHMKETNDAFKSFIEPIEIADKITRGKILAFQLKQKLIREEQEAINALRLEAAKKEMELKGELTESVNLVEVMPPPLTTVRTDMGTASTFMVRKWATIDFSLVPDGLKVIDGVKVGKLVRAGIPSISGIRIWEEPSLRVNTQHGRT